MLIKVNGIKEPVYIDGFLYNKYMRVVDMIKKNWDAVILVDGMEGSGKSTFAAQGATIISTALNVPFTIDHIVADAQSAMEKLEKMPDNSVLMIDEGSLVFSSKDTMKKEQRQLINVMQIIRQKNMTLFIVLPQFFELTKYIAVHRSLFLCHIYADGAKKQRGRFAYFSTKGKNKLFILGKKNFNSYDKPKANFRGRFTSWFPFDKEKYNKIKRQSLSSAFEDNSTKKGMGIYEKLHYNRLALLVFMLRTNGIPLTHIKGEFARANHAVAEKVLRELYQRGQEICLEESTKGPKNPPLIISLQNGSNNKKKGEGIPLPNSKNHND